MVQVLTDRLNPLLHKPAFPAGVVQQPRDHGDSVPGLYSGSFLETRGRLSSGSITSEDSPALTPRWLSIKSNSSSDNCFEGSKRVVSWSDRHVFDAEFMDLMKQEVDSQLDRLKGDVTGLENYALPDNGYIIGTHLGMSLDVMLIEIDERFNALKLLLAAVFRQAREMASSSVSDLQLEHELQLEIINITIGEFIGGLQEEMERKLYEQISMTNSMSKNWQDAITQFASIRDDLGALSKLLFPSLQESHIAHSKHENSGSRSNRWKYNFFGKKNKEDHSSRAEENKSFRKQKSIVVSEKSDFRHLNGMSTEEIISYFKTEMSKLKRMHELDLQEKTEELFKFKREKGLLALKNDVEFEPLRKKIPQIISRMDQIISKNIKMPSLCMTHDGLDERCISAKRIDSLYYENQHLRGLLADNMKDVKELSSQLSEASREMSRQLLSEDDLQRQIDKIKEEYEDLRIETDVRDGVYQTVTRKMLDDSMNSMHDAATNFDAELISLEAVIYEKEKALCSSNEKNRMLQEKITELEQCSIQDNQKDPEVIKQESTEIILRDIEVASHISPRISQETLKQDLQYDELVKLNSSLEIATAALKEVEKKNIDYNGIFTKNEQEKQLECILISIMKLSKEFVEIEQKLSVERSASRSEDLSDHCNHMVRQAVVLTKIGLWYKQVLETRRSELQKAEAKVVILGDKVNAHLNLLEKIYVTLDRYSPTLQQYPGLLDAFLKTCKLVAGLRSNQNKDDIAT
uniref:WPP domain-associated protein n=1 Tax=Oryza brachyantha TaxID=4533 RepID=J3LTG3_ORYBR